MLIGLPRQISEISKPSLSLPSNYPITPTDYVRNLGFIFDSSFTFSKQISSLSSACNYHIRDLRRIKQTLDLKTASIIATCLVHSKLDYCNSLYLNLPQKQISHLQLLQNFLARAVTGTPKTEHITPVLKFLHWLNIEDHIHYKIISLTYDFLHTSLPQYLRKLINIKLAGSTRCLNHLILLHPSTTSSLKISNRLYNELLLSSVIIYPNLWKPSLTRHLILQSQVDVPPYHSHFHRPNFAFISKHTFLASHSHLNLLSCLDWLHQSLP